MNTDVTEFLGLPTHRMHRARNRVRNWPVEADSSSRGSSSLVRRPSCSNLLRIVEVNGKRSSETYAQSLRSVVPEENGVSYTP